MLSVVAICKNELANAKAFVNSWSELADEIVIVDTGSTDGTISLLERIEQENHKLRVFHFKWNEDFSAARNFANSKAVGTWILWADLDDRIDIPSIPKIKEISRKKHNSVFRFQVCSDVGFGKWQRFMQIRMFPNFPSIQFSGKIHESVNGSVDGLEIKDECDIIVAHLGYQSEPVRKQKAVRNLSMLLRDGNPETADGMAQVGDSLFVLGKFFVGLGFYEQACRIDPSFKALLAEKLCIGYLFVSAIEKARAALKEIPEGTISRRYLEGEILFHEGKKGEAVKMFQSAIHGERTLGMRECNGDVLAAMATNRVKELVECVLA